MAKKANNEPIRLESIEELNASNVWGLDAWLIANLWEKEKGAENFANQEEKLLNVLRIAFEVVHFDPENERDNEKYGNESEWAQLSSVVNSKNKIAIKAKVIGKVGDLNMQNVKTISAAPLLDLINRNFGSGWDALPSHLKEIIESAFDISTSQLPTSRLHLPGGSLERKVKAGYDVLEIPKGTWTEAIFARKKELADESLYQADAAYDDDRLIVDDDEDFGNDEDNGADDTFYSSFADETRGEDDEDLEGLDIKTEEELDRD